MLPLGCLDAFSLHVHQQLTLYYKSIVIPEPLCHASFTHFQLELFYNYESDICLLDKKVREKREKKRKKRL